ncbi:MAG: toast rack family protein [Candidatus Aminicenantes bacterium]|jgi:hypothetical protein
MKFANIRKITLVILLAAGFVGCEVAGQMIDDTHTIELGRAEFVDVKLDMGVGEMNLFGGARDLMEAEFRYNIDHWKPEVKYRVTGSRGVLTVKQGKSRRMTVGRKRNEWDIGLNDDVPIHLTIDCGVGQSKLDLAGLTLKFLDIDMGVGELIVDLSGGLKQSLDIVIDCGIGSATVYLPEEIGIRARIDHGIGSVNARGFKKRGDVYTNNAYGETEISIDIEVDSGIGSLDLKLR